MSFARRHAITDICLLVADAERSVAFYVDKLGFVLRRRAEGFADFEGAGLTLAVWEIGHMAPFAGISPRLPDGVVHKACVAVRLGTPAEVDATMVELSAKGVVFTQPAADYPWNARAAYFLDPDDNVWELYAWHAEGPMHDFDLTRPAE